MLFGDSHEFGNNGVDGAGLTGLPAPDTFVCTKLVDVYLGSNELYFSMFKQNEAFEVISENRLDLFYFYLLKWVHSVMPDPFIHLYLSELSLIMKIVSSSYPSVKCHERSWLVEVEFGGWDEEKLQIGEELLI